MSDEGRKNAAGGTPASEATLTRLIKAEQQAQALLDAAENNVRDILRDAEHEAERRIEDMGRAAEAAVAGRRSELEGRTQRAVQRKLDDTQADIANLKMRTKSDFEHAVQLVVATVTGLPTR